VLIVTASVAYEPVVGLVPTPDLLAGTMTMALEGQFGTDTG
jgi:hypothetical protein